MRDPAALLYCAGGGIGDSFVSTVVAQALRSRFARVDALTLRGHRATLERCPDLAEVLVDDGTGERALVRTIAQRDYGACVVTWATARTARVAQRAQIPIRVGQARRLYSWRFTERVIVRSELGDVTSPWSEIMLDFARSLGCDAPGARPRFVPTEQDVREAAGAFSEPAFVIMHPANAEATKRGIWPTAGWSALARALRQRFNLPVVVTGSSADRAIVDAIARDAEVVDLAGRLEIGAFGALAARARAFVGITTGTMHVAAAVGCPTVGIFPFQSDYSDRWGPRGEKTAVVRASYPCHPGDTKETCVDFACIAHLDVPRILATMSTLL